MNKIIEFIKGANKEFKKVSWPSKDEVMDSTIVVIVSVIMIAIVLGLMDLSLRKIIAVVLQHN